MLINLTNHPSCRWGSDQLQAASKYAELVDVPFPQIPAEFSIEQVHSLALYYLEKCRNMLETGGQKKNAIHIAGEPTFCFILVQLLLREGYVCLISTTERIVRENNTEKISIFQFRKFRTYPLIAAGSTGSLSLNINRKFNEI